MTYHDWQAIEYLGMLTNLEALGVFVLAGLILGPIVFREERGKERERRRRE